MLTLINETDHEAKLVRVNLDEENMVGIVVVKSTYDIANGRASLSRRQRRVLMAPETEDGVDFEPEGVLGKVGVDLIVVGAAAGDGHTRVSAVSVRIGEWSSRALVFGDRRWRRSLRRWTATEPSAFFEMPVAWSTAFGGIARCNGIPLAHQGNPQGKGYIIDVDDDIEGAVLPNVEDPEDLLERPGQTVQPFGFAPLPTSSALRIEAALDESKAEGISKAIYNVAHPRHRLAELHGGERCELGGWVGMGAEVFELPPESFVVEVGIADRRYEFEPQIDTVCMWATQRQLVVTRRATFIYHYLRGAPRVARLRQFRDTALVAVGGSHG
jgi:hypothetical protein